MKTHLVAHGNSRAVVLPAAVRRLLGINDRTTLEVTTDGTSLVLTPTTAAKQAELFERAYKVLENDAQHKKALMLLADR